MAIRIHEIIKITEEIGIEETVGMEDPITVMIDEIIEAEETVMIKIEAEDIVETIMVETEGQAQHTATDHGVREVLHEDEIVDVMIGIDMIDIGDGLAKARGEKKKDIITRKVLKRMKSQNSNLHGNGSLLTKKEI